MTTQRRLSGRRLRVLWPWFLLAGVILLFFNRLAFTDLIFARGDVLLYFYPYWQAAAAALRGGVLPLWNPSLFMGAPLLANSQMGFFYPLNWPLWWLFSTPVAVKATILLHLFIAGSGAYLAGRRVLSLGRPAALLPAVAFAAGGYLTAQVEHVNQLQGLAWLPWFLVALNLAAEPTRRARLQATIAVALLFALQLLAGHMQTAFISGVALGLWVTARAIFATLSPPEGGSARREGWAGMWILALGAALALLIAAVQLVPSLQLTALSARQGGLAVNEVLSFSLSPLLSARSLLPSYAQSLFTEYVAFLPVTWLALAFVGAWGWRRSGPTSALLLWVAAGLLLALGFYNPLNWLLARLPVFDFFRVPARWLILYALAMSLLAGAGLQNFIDATADKVPAQVRHAAARPLPWFLLVVVILAAWGVAAGLLAPLLPPGAEAPFERPNSLTLAGWAVELLFIGGLWFTLRQSGRGRAARISLVLMTVTGLAALFLASRSLPYHHLTTPEAFADLRPPAARLMAAGGSPPGRFLSLSDILFDPGDLAEIESIYGQQLPPDALYDYTVAIKEKEIIAPNLPMVYGLQAVDGFDGGILPLRSYSRLTSLLLAGGAQTTDGRLREHLNQTPDAAWLDLFNAQFLITDKTGDVWIDGVFFDRQHPLQLPMGATAEVGYVPPFEATELRLLASERPRQVEIATAGGRRWQLEPVEIGGGEYRLDLPFPAVPISITVGDCAHPDCTLIALTLVDRRDGAFQPLVPGNYRLIHSGDVKIYENLDVLPRAMLFGDWQWAADAGEALAIMAGDSFQVGQTAVLTGGPGSPMPDPDDDAPALTAEIVSYAAGRVVVRTHSDEERLLVLSDAAYPGWRATLDGAPAPIVEANLLFRGLFVPAGAHEIIFEFQAPALAAGALITLLAIAAVIALIIIAFRFL